MSDFIFDAKVREEHGTGASRRLRRNKLIPGIVYGGDKAPVSLTLDHDKVNLAQEKEAFYSQVLTLNVDGKPEQVIVKALQRHPYKPKLLHVDFQRIKAGAELTTIVPLHFLNEEESVGARAGGTIVHLLNEVEVKCTPENMPEFIEVDMLNIDNGHAVHLSDLPLPAGVELVELNKGDDHDLTVAQVQPPKGGSDADDAEDATDDSTAESGDTE
ncbi:50S ribosomal protein L25/general stress protein Ctc [Ferrimonas senticii]|uniref:50S ribosomal protein L25/general stress protein Ctc n=1 Tax=Ferrimonas senticii TaxID=394566 RepID=UPI000401F3CB|nr:50S ribosomal protein L25/general stress protein Ctc [Ferrimonas senticii]